MPRLLAVATTLSNPNCFSRLTATVLSEFCSATQSGTVPM